MCKKQKHIDMLEKFYTNIAEALNRAASEELTNTTVQNKRRYISPPNIGISTLPGWIC